MISPTDFNNLRLNPALISLSVVSNPLYMRNYVLGFVLAGSLLASERSSAQVGIGIGVGPRGYGYGGGMYRRVSPQRRVQRGPQQPPFKPVVNFSVGYGYPSLDKNQFVSFYNYYRGTVDDKGTITGALDVQFSRTSSIGAIVSHGFMRTSYYDYANMSGPPSLTASLENWSVMLNFMNYIPVSEQFQPYIRTAIGLNFWDERYKDPTGAKMNVGGEPTQLAYQVGLGAKAFLSKNTGLFVEAGYGKYILHGGLTFRL